MLMFFLFFWQVLPSYLCNEVTTVLCVCMRNEDLYAEEWINYHLLLGFNKIHIFDNNHIESQLLRNISNIYRDKIIVERTTRDGTQLLSYRRCLRAHNKTNTWGAFFDADEFLVLKKHFSINDFVKSFYMNSSIGAISFNWIMFGSNGHKDYSPEPVLERFTQRGTCLNHHVKTMSHIPDVMSQGHHNSELFNGKIQVDPHGNQICQPVEVGQSCSFSPFNFYGTEDVAVLHHYCTKSYAEHTSKRLRGRAAVPRSQNQYLGPNGFTHIWTSFVLHDGLGTGITDRSAIEFRDKLMAYRRIT